MPRWEKASWTDHKSIDQLLVRDVDVLDVYSFTSFISCGFLLQYPRKVSVINAKVGAGQGAGQGHLPSAATGLLVPHRCS